jgi:hypothetical protein
VVLAPRRTTSDLSLIAAIRGRHVAPPSLPGVPSSESSPSLRLAIALACFFACLRSRRSRTACSRARLACVCGLLEPTPVTRCGRGSSYAVRPSSRLPVLGWPVREREVLGWPVRERKLAHREQPPRRP